MINVINKKYIIKSEWKRNYDLFSERPSGFTLCISHKNVIFQSFFQKFLIGLCRICLRAKVHNLVFIICSLLLGSDCVTDKLKATCTFSWMKKTHSFILKFSPQHAENHIFWALKFQNFLGRNTLRSPPSPPPAPRKGDQGPLVDTVSYSIQTADYFNFYWNPWVQVCYVWLFCLNMFCCDTTLWYVTELVLDQWWQRIWKSQTDLLD